MVHRHLILVLVLIDSYWRIIDDDPGLNQDGPGCSLVFWKLELFAPCSFVMGIGRSWKVFEYGSELDPDGPG